MTLTAETISIQWAPSADEIPYTLWDACFPPPLEGYWWYHALERCGIDDQFSFAYAVIEKSGRRVGIAPTFIMDLPIDLVAPPLIATLLKKIDMVFPGLRYQRTLFVGSPCADEGTVGLVSGCSLAEVGPALQRSLEMRARVEQVSMIVWKDFRDGSEQDIETLCKTCGLFRLISYPGTRLPLKVDGFTQYLEKLSSDQRYKLKMKLRKSHDMGVLDEAAVQFPDNSFIEEIYYLFRQTYERGKTKFERLTPDFFRIIASEPTSYFITLQNPSTGKLVAFMLCFLVGKRVINKYIGLDYAYEGNWFLYFRLWEVAVKWAIQMDAEELQSGQTGYMAKHDVGHSLVSLTNYCRHLNPVVNYIFKRIAHHITWSTMDLQLQQIGK